MAARNQAASKEVTVLSRLEIKADIRKVVYTVLSSNGKDKYETSLFNGRGCSCTCPATTPRCYHITQLEIREAARKAAPVSDMLAAPLNSNNRNFSLMR